LPPLAFTPRPTFGHHSHRWGAGLQWAPMGNVGAQRAWELNGDHIVRATGCGQIADGIGRVMNPGRGPVITMVTGRMTRLIFGSGFLESNGRPHGYLGAWVVATSDGHRTPHQELGLS